MGRGRNDCDVIIRREGPGDAADIRQVTAAAFRDAEHSAPPSEPGGDPGEVALIDQLRADDGWIAELSFVAVHEGQVIGHVVGSRAYLGARPVVGLGPLSVLPDRQRFGTGSALMHTVLGASDALGYPLVGLLGDPGYYRRFGFVAAASLGVESPDASWGDYFQVRSLGVYAGETGQFQYAAPFAAV